MFREGEIGRGEMASEVRGACGYAPRGGRGSVEDTEAGGRLFAFLGLFKTFGLSQCLFFINLKKN